MTKRQAFLLFFVILVIITTLGWILRGYIHEAIIVPLTFLLWIASRLIQAVDQVILWLLFLLIVIALMVRSLTSQPEPKEIGPTPTKWSGVNRRRFWLGEIHLLINSKTPSRYPVHEIRKLFLTVLAYTHHLDISEVEKALKTDQLPDIPPGLWKRLEFEEEPAVRSFDFPAALSRWRSLFRRTSRLSVNDHPRLKTLRDLLDIMETQLEIKHDH